MIVAYLINQYPRASHSFIRREIHALEAQGLTVHRFTIRPFTEVVDEADKAEEPKTHVLLRAPALLRGTFAALFTRPGKFLSSLKLAMKVARRSDRGLLINLVYLAEACCLLRLLRARRVEHLHAHFGTNSATVAMLTRVLGGPPYSFTCHGPEEFDRPAALSLDEKVAHSKFAVAISSFGKSQLFRWALLADWSKIQIVHCGLDAQFLSAPAQPIPTEPKLVCVGRLSEQKGQLLLLEAAAQLAREGMNFKLTLVGDGPMRGVIERHIRALNLTRQVDITGWMTNAQVREQIEQSRAMVLPSFAEGLPVVIMEALALHRPVISTSVAGIPELVEPNVTGWLVPAGALDPLVDAMRDALTAPVERLSKMACAGAEKVALMHNASIEAAKLAVLFQA